MTAALLESFKRLLTALGSALPEPALHQLQMVLNYMKLGRWMARHNFRFGPREWSREEVFGAVAKRVGDRRALYLEFGVFEGASMRYWSGRLKHPAAALHGFDSFQGLPEDFDVSGPLTKGTFCTEGKIPVIDDPRVKFFKGWFDEVLPSYAVPEHEVLVINMDADLRPEAPAAVDPPGDVPLLRRPVASGTRAEGLRRVYEGERAEVFTRLGRPVAQSRGLRVRRLNGVAGYSGTCRGRCERPGP
jgi:hypothetical protein